MGLFLGPLLTLYKAASAVCTARSLERETGIPCVPLFWMQTDDHDLAEIDHCVIPCATGNLLRVSLGISEAAQNRVPVEHLAVPPSITCALDALHAELAAQPFGPEHLALLKRAYQPGAPLAQAFAELLAAAFAQEGLLLFDSRRADLATAAASVHRHAFRSAERISTLLTTRASEMNNAGFQPQVHVRTGSPLSFLSADGASGARHRLEPVTTGTWRLWGDPQDRTVSTLQVEDWLENEPLRASTSALLRPLLQDSWLPTAAYVGGPAEVAYFAQVVPLYAHFGLEMPLVIHRARFRILDDRTLAILKHLRLTPDDVEHARDVLLRRLVEQRCSHVQDRPEQVEARMLGPLLAELTSFGELGSAIDPGFPRAVERARDTVRDSLVRLVARYAKALAQRDQVSVDRLDRVRAYLLPEDAPQERVMGLPYYACRFGIRPFVQHILDACVPYSAALKDVTP
jgi:bacillithiol biosynthesis cysteine-adding enzyme BshC